MRYLQHFMLRRKCCCCCCCYIHVRRSTVRTSYLISCSSLEAVSSVRRHRLNRRWCFKLMLPTSYQVSYLYLNMYYCMCCDPPRWVRCCLRGQSILAQSFCRRRVCYAFGRGYLIQYSSTVVVPTTDALGRRELSCQTDGRSKTRLILDASITGHVLEGLSLLRLMSPMRGEGDIVMRSLLSL